MPRHKLVVFFPNLKSSIYLFDHTVLLVRDVIKQAPFSTAGGISYPGAGLHLQATPKLPTVS